MVFWKREIFLSKKKFGGKKINLAKAIFPSRKLTNTFKLTHRNEQNTEKLHILACNIFIYHMQYLYSPFCVPAKVTKSVGLKNGGRVSPTNLITFAGTQNGEYIFYLWKNGKSLILCRFRG